MNTRIRYTKTNELNVLESTRVFAVGATSFRVRLNTAEKSFVVFDSATDVIAASGTGASMALVKARVKETLASLGYMFASEKRVRTAVDSTSAA